VILSPFRDASAYWLLWLYLGPLVRFKHYVWIRGVTKEWSQWSDRLCTDTLALHERAFPLHLWTEAALEKRARNDGFLLPLYYFIAVDQEIERLDQERLPGLNSGAPNSECTENMVVS